MPARLTFSTLRRATAPRSISRSKLAPLSRALHKTALLSMPRKDSQDKDSIDTEPTEYSRSGTDAGAAQESGAFDPSTTKPDEEKSQAGKSSGVSNLLIRNSYVSAFEMQAQELEHWMETNADFYDVQGNPLDVSPANPDVSKQRGQTEGGAESSGNDGKSRSSGGGNQSGFGSGPKNSKA